MTAPKYYYIVGRVQPGVVALRRPGCIGYVPLFETREAAAEAYPGHDIIMVEAVPTEEPR